MDSLQKTKQKPHKDDINKKLKNINIKNNNKKQKPNCKNP